MNSKKIAKIVFIISAIIVILGMVVFTVAPLF